MWSNVSRLEWSGVSVGTVLGRSVAPLLRLSLDFLAARRRRSVTSARRPVGLAAARREIEREYS